MKRSLSAFVTYDPADSFVQGGPDGTQELAFVRKIEMALQAAGFSNVFMESDGSIVEAGENRDNRIG